MMKISKLIFSDIAKERIAEYGELCIAVAREEMERCKLNFDDIEKINDHYEEHRWGSNTDRAYRKRSINKAVQKVAANPLNYGSV